MDNEGGINMQKKFSKKSLMIWSLALIGLLMLGYIYIYTF